ncbi:helix-turn-helix transcriptional regulator [Joostella atrarenae]|uniref:Helix-turn-helix transcriptional regulator n=1 Tax=Joostella atrarenae TaxID=679257 RepID=A0ABS9J7V7_9FLAO|nr:helix-turn-helix transcriptional regulator [Joostella atrarenae]MCF8716499.1 helix-turn-helix transcriptional regulator [Joostella atrarenae]
MDSRKVDDFLQNVLIEIGNKIKEEREQRNLKLIDTDVSSDIDPGDFSRYENGIGNPTLKTLIRISIALKLESFEIFGLEFPLEDFIEE